MADDKIPEPNPEPNPDTDKKFTQSDVDRIIQDRLARVKPATPDDYDDLKAKAAKLDEIEQANATELEKAMKRAEAAEQAADQAVSRARAANIRSAVTSAATMAGAVDPDAVLAMLNKDAVTVGDDGQVTGADEAVKALLELKPYLVGQPAEPVKPAPSGDGGPRGSGGTNSQLDRDDIPKLSDDEFAKAMAEGRFADLLGGKP